MWNGGEEGGKEKRVTCRLEKRAWPEYLDVDCASYTFGVFVCGRAGRPGGCGTVTSDGYM